MSALMTLRGNTLERARLAQYLVVSLIAALVCFASAKAELGFGEPQFLPGDEAMGAPAGMQMFAAIAPGSSSYLAVWSDYRSAPDHYPPFQTEGSGADIYGALIDANGNVIGPGTLVLNQDPGDQMDPTVAWNGSDWLVVWKQETPTLPAYEQMYAIRVGQNGTVLDASPILLHSNQSYYYDPVATGGNGEWVAIFQANGPMNGLVAVRIGADGAILNPGGQLVHSTNFLISYDLAFAQDEYMIIWSGSFDTARGKRYTPELQLISTHNLPFAQRIATDGNDFLLGYASGQPPLATVEAALLSHAGIPQPPITLYTGGNQGGTCCVDTNWDGSNYWLSWGGPKLARITSDGQVLDPGGFSVWPEVSHPSTPAIVGAPTGGLQMVYNSGVNGAGYKKDVYTSRVSATGNLENEILASVGAPAQMESDFAEGDAVHLAVFISRESEQGRILAHRLDATGAALDAEPIEVASGPMPGYGLPFLGNPGVAWNGSNFMIVWSNGTEIFARRMLPGGSFLDAEPQTIMDGHSPDVAAVGHVYLVVGLDYLLGNGQYQATHSMRVDGLTGQNLDPEPNALGGFVVYARYPHVVSWGDRWLAVWQLNLSHDNSIAGTAAAIVNADGTTPGVINVPQGWRPDVAVSDDKALFVSVDNTVASATTDLIGVIMAADGTFPGSYFTISDAPDKQLRPAVAWNGTDFIVAWEDKRNTPIYYDTRTDIYGSRVSSAGAVLDPEGIPLAARETVEIQPSLASIGGAIFLGFSELRPEPHLGALRLGIRIDDGLTSTPQDAPQQADASLRLLGAHPNPANPSTEIRFEYGGAEPVSLVIFDVSGRRVRTLMENRRLDSPGTLASVHWDGRNNRGQAVKSGVFLYQLRTPSESVGGKLVILK